jgi:twitching motility protein PilT
MLLPDLLGATHSLGGSDLHLSVGSPPQVRVDGHLRRLDAPVLTPESVQALAYSVLTDQQKKKFEEHWELDMAFGLNGVGRFRCNVFLQKGAVGAVFRLIPETIRTLDELGLPPVISRLADRPRGLVLVTGPTGSGKTTTLAAMIDRVNAQRPAHILTIEDPIEYLHPHKMSLVNQRELHADTHTFSQALRAALREDPDVVLVGEMRDLETMEAAMKLAETGHLTLATLHTNSAAQTVTRIVDAFPSHQQAQIRTQLSLVLEGIICQALLPKASGNGRAAALEILVATPAIRNLIRDDKVHQIYSTMQSGQEK